MSLRSKTRQYYDVRNEIVMKEGDYASYSEKWGIDLSAVGDAITTGDFYVQGDQVFFTDLAPDANEIKTFIRALADGAAIDEDDLTGPSLNNQPKFASASIFRRYVVRALNNGIFEIWKNGTLLQTITIGGVAPQLNGLDMSFDGRYILVCDGNNEFVYLYEGA